VVGGDPINLWRIKSTGGATDQLAAQNSPRRTELGALMGSQIPNPWVTTFCRLGFLQQNLSCLVPVLMQRVEPAHYYVRDVFSFRHIKVLMRNAKDVQEQARTTQLTRQMGHLSHSTLSRKGTEDNLALAIRPHLIHDVL
jgi:hypothetical protein